MVTGQYIIQIGKMPYLELLITNDYNFSARANLLGKIPFRASVGYNNTEGVVKKNDYERITASLRLTPKFLDDHLKVDVNAKGTIVDKNAIDEGGALGGGSKNGSDKTHL